MAEFNPTHCIIENATITNAAGDTKNITGVIGEFSFVQSIDSIAFSGQLIILDGVGLLENFGLRGEEELNLLVHSYDFGTKVRLKAQIYRIDGVQRSEDGGSLFYTLHFISKTSYKADLRKVTEAYSQKSAGYIAEQVFKKNYSELEVLSKDYDGIDLPSDFSSKRFKLKSDPERTFTLQKTYGDLHLTIPTFRPANAMEFIAKKSYSKESLSNSFRFFENFDGYHFVTDEFLFEKARNNPGTVHTLYYFPVVDKTVNDIEVQRRTIESYTNARRAHTGSDLYNGAYVNKAIEIDLLQHKVNFKTFNYLKDAKYFSGQGKAALIDDVHTEDFIKETFTENNAKQFMVYRDYSGPEHIHPNPPLKPSVRGDQFYSEIKANRAAYSQHVNSNMVEMGLKGGLRIQAGDCVNLVMPDINIGSDRQVNDYTAGTYLVTKASHHVKEGVLTTMLSAIKYGFVGNR